MSGGKAGLEELQEWLQRVVTGDPDGRIDAGEVAEHVTPTRRATAVRQAEIYRDLYWTRMVDVLADDFPGTRRHLGDGPFRAAGEAYVRENPSRARSLTRYGAGFPAFLDGADDPVAAELARLEWALREVFHAPRDPTIGTDDLLAIPKERFGDVAFTPVRALRLLSFEHDVDSRLAALRRRDARGNSRGDAPPPAAPAPCRLLVHREGDFARRRRLEPAAYVVLDALCAGERLEGAFARLARLEDPDVDVESAAGRIPEWFRDWTAAGLFRAVGW